VDKEPTLTKAPPKGKLFPCLNCGAKVEFDPRSRSLKCPYCGFTSKVEDDGGAVEERDFNEYASKLVKGNVGGIAGRSTQTRCGTCGAMVLLEDKVVTDKCPFCGTHLENKPEAVEGMLPPESLIPFKVDLRHARDSFEKWLGNLWFAPTELRQIANLGQLTGVYLPYWTYDAMTYTKYRGMRGDDYQETEYYTEKDASGNEVQKSRTVTRTNWYPVSGEVQHFFDDVLVCGSKSIPPHLISGLEPWDTGELEPFQDSFLAGLKTERYAVDLKAGLKVAKEMMQPTIHTLIRRDIGGDHQRIEVTDTRYIGVTFKHCLLPVWVASYRYREKLFQILVNGRTGTVSGERPWSWLKILRLVALILLVVALIAALAAVFGKGGGGSGAPPKGRKADAALRADERVAGGRGARPDQEEVFGPHQHLARGALGRAGPDDDQHARARRGVGGQRPVGEALDRVHPDLPRRRDPDRVPPGAVHERPGRHPGAPVPAQRDDHLARRLRV
jgi:DNA-directed RNA polymerase subunit RPC12/RpoP